MMIFLVIRMVLRMYHQNNMNLWMFLVQMNIIIMVTNIVILRTNYHFHNNILILKQEFCLVEPSLQYHFDPRHHNHNQVNLKFQNYQRVYLNQMMKIIQNMKKIQMKNRNFVNIFQKMNPNINQKLQLDQYHHHYMNLKHNTQFEKIQQTIHNNINIFF